jgi:hypothetical protein
VNTLAVACAHAAQLRLAADAIHLLAVTSV